MHDQMRSQIEALSDDLTPAERKLAAALLSDYPFSGLDTIQNFSKKTKVSAPSITRFVHKLGCQGYQEFQRRLIDELKEGQRSPVDLHRSQGLLQDKYLQGFLDRAASLVTAAAEGISEKQFDRICGLLGDEKRAIYVIGGRLSDLIAQHLSRHLRPIRRFVYHLPADPEVWPEYILRMRSKDVFVVFDFRRYQDKLEELAEAAVRVRGVNVIAVTDKWTSPVARHATDVLSVPIDNGTIWDSYAGALALVEAMVAHVGEQDWDKTRARFEAWDAVRLDQGKTDDDP